MKVLIAEDDMVSRRLLEATLVKWGYEVVVTCDGTAAWEVLQGVDAPPLAILDWMMPGMDGTEVCRRVRHAPIAHTPLSDSPHGERTPGRYHHGSAVGRGRLCHEAL